MHKKLLLGILFLAFGFVNGQTRYETIKSSKLGTSRDLKIQLPRNYEHNETKKYPVILVLDGDYLFEPMAGIVDYYSYWDNIPEAIVVGVNQVKSRDNDSFYDDVRFLPSKTGAEFFEFLGMELMPYLDKNFRTTPFTVIAGHDLTANFINYYLLKERAIFDAFINLSPDLAPEMADRLETSLKNIQKPQWYYLATAEEDIPELKEDIMDLDQRLKLIENSNLHYTFDNLEGSDHYTLTGKALINALQSIFNGYGPISIKEYDTRIVNSEISPFQYLVDKYDRIEKNYKLTIPIRVNDFMAVGKALEFHQNWNALEDLGDLARNHYPRSMLGTYYLARAYEATGHSRKAMKTYQSAYEQDPVAHLTVDFMLQRAELIKEDFGY